MERALIRLALLLGLIVSTATAYGSLAGGRPNSFSEGQNAFAGVVNPANAVWLQDRLDVGAYWVRQKFTIDNRDNTRFFPPGKTDFSYRAKGIFTADAAIHKRFNSTICCKPYDYSFTLAYYSTPNIIKIRTKTAIPGIGSTPLKLKTKIEAISLIFSLKLNESHSVGASIDYFFFTRNRSGFQNADNPLRSVSPGNVTNRGTDRSSGVGCTLGWRWRITKFLDFGMAWIGKSFCGSFRKYRGYEAHHGHNYFPQMLGGGFSCRFTPRIAGRLEVLWSNFGNLPASNNNILPNGRLNLNKRGSNKSPGPGLRDATFVNVGIGYRLNAIASIGASYSHRFRYRANPIILSRTYTLQTTYDLFALGTNIKYKKHDLFLTFSYGLKNRRSGVLPQELGNGKFVAEKSLAALSFSWGYLY